MSAAPYSLEVITPVVWADSHFVSSTLSEADYTAWSGATTYAANDYCILTTGYHRIYKSLQAGNLNHHPVTDAAADTWWIEVNPTNRWGVLDGQVGTYSSATTTMTHVLAPGRINALALLEVDAATVRVLMTNAAATETYYDTTYTLPDSAVVGDWFAYFYEPINRKRELVVMDLPVIGDARLSITVAGDTGATVTAGMLAAGMVATIGDTLASPTVGIVDYSRKGTDDWGRPVFVERSYVKRMDLRLVLPSPLVDAVQTKLAGLRATPAVWIGAGSRYGALTIYGWFKDFAIDIAYIEQSFCTLTIEGLA
jgi:hypothetical protein